MISRQQPYVKMLCEDYNGRALTEEQGAELKGKWASVFGNENPIDLEVGTGSGHFFAHKALTEPHRNILGIELKFKPLIQAIQKCDDFDNENFRIVRFRAEFIDLLVEKEEIADTYIHFPDPWPKRVQQKHRLLKQSFFNKLITRQKPGSLLQIKTDSAHYFEFILKNLEQTPYQMLTTSWDFHKDKLEASEKGELLKSRETPPTQFEGIFLRQNLPIHFGLWKV